MTRMPNLCRELYALRRSGAHRHPTGRRRRYYEQTGEALGGEAIRSMLDLLEARAQFNAPERTIHVRSAEHGRPARWRRPRLTQTARHSSRKVAANGRFCAVGVGLRDGLLAAGHVLTRL